MWTPAPCAPVLELKAPAEPRALLALAVFTVWFGPETVLDPQREYGFQFCVVLPERPVVGFEKLP